MKTMDKARSFDETYNVDLTLIELNVLDIALRVAEDKYWNLAVRAKTDKNIEKNERMVLRIRNLKRKLFELWLTDYDEVN